MKRIVIGIVISSMALFIVIFDLAAGIVAVCDIVRIASQKQQQEKPEIVMKVEYDDGLTEFERLNKQFGVETWTAERPTTNQAYERAKRRVTPRQIKKGTAAGPFERVQPNVERSDELARAVCDTECMDYDSLPLYLVRVGEELPEIRMNDRLQTIAPETEYAVVLDYSALRTMPYPDTEEKYFGGAIYACYVSRLKDGDYGCIRVGVWDAASDQIYVSQIPVQAEGANLVLEHSVGMGREVFCQRADVANEECGGSFVFSFFTSGEGRREECSFNLDGPCFCGDYRVKPI